MSLTTTETLELEDVNRAEWNEAMQRLKTNLEHMCDEETQRVPQAKWYKDSGTQTTSFPYDLEPTDKVVFVTVKTPRASGLLANPPKVKPAWLAAKKAGPRDVLPFPVFSPAFSVWSR